MPKNILVTLFIVLITSVITGCHNKTQTFNSGTGANQATDATPSRSQLGDQAFWQGNTNTIWDRLQYIPLHKLEAAATGPDATQNAWIKLAIISKRDSKNYTQLTQQLITWRRENASHPGNALFPNDATLNSLTNQTPPTRIAVLLPLQGPLGPSGQAVRDGFLSAYYDSLAKTQVKQTISFYDTNQKTAISLLYQQAVKEGAELVVGPLAKTEVQTLLYSGNISIPTIALNYTDNSLPNNVYEFGLSSRDESQQVANKAWQAGLAHAIIIAPQNGRGQQIAKALTARWQSLGGTVTDKLYVSNNVDLSSSIANLMHVNPKEDRKKMREDNTKTNLESQRRQDFDVIFLAVEPQTARQIVPLLKFYYADNIPIYATSIVYSGTPNPAKDSDLNGVVFLDIPWLLKKSNSNRLNAVGRDAFAISNALPRLSQLPNFPLYAATGALTLTNQHQIYRRLPWTQMHEGHP